MSGLVSKVENLKSCFPGLGSQFGVYCRRFDALDFRVQGSGFRVQGLWLEVQG